MWPIFWHRWRRRIWNIVGISRERAAPDKQKKVTNITRRAAAPPCRIKTVEVRKVKHHPSGTCLTISTTTTMIFVTLNRLRSHAALLTRTVTIKSSTNAFLRRLVTRPVPGISTSSKKIVTPCSPQRRNSFVVLPKQRLRLLI